MYLFINSIFKKMRKLSSELIDKMRKANGEYERITNLLVPLGFTLCMGAIFYGEPPFNIYCGKMEDYQSFIDNIDKIKEEHIEHKKRMLGTNPKSLSPSVARLNDFGPNK